MRADALKIGRAALPVMRGDASIETVSALV
jgi:hypothetical protein